jgi:hypothetical protein
MDQARWYIVFAVVLSMIFTLAALHRFSQAQPPSTREETLGTQVSAAPEVVPASELPRVLPVKEGGLAATPIQLSPPPLFCFENPTSQDIDAQFRQMVQRVRSDNAP